MNWSVSLIYWEQKWISDEPMCSVRRVWRAAAKGYVGLPTAADLCLAKGHHSVMCRSWYTSPYPPPCPNFTLIPPWSWGFAWIYADNPDSLLKPPPPPTLFTKTPHQTVQQGVISWTKGRAHISAVPILAFNFTNFKERLVFKMDSTFHLIITNLSLTETNQFDSPVCCHISYIS